MGTEKVREEREPRKRMGREGGWGWERESGAGGGHEGTMRRGNEYQHLLVCLAQWGRRPRVQKNPRCGNIDGVEEWLDDKSVEGKG